jgi:hypothetical protein
VGREEDTKEAMWWLLVCERGGGEQMTLGFQINRKLTGFVLGDDKLGHPMKINS